jgi:hypothetical protein
MDDKIITGGGIYVATDVTVADDFSETHAMVAVLRPDQLDLIREIIRDEIAASRAKGGVW